MVAVAGIKVCVWGQIHKLSEHCCFHSLQFEVHRDVKLGGFRTAHAGTLMGLSIGTTTRVTYLAHTHTPSTTLSLVDKEQGLYSCDVQPLSILPAIPPAVL